MSRNHRRLHPEFPLHVTARTNNREPFPLPLNICWEIFSDYLYLLHHGFGIEIHSFVLMINHFHLLCRDPLGLLSKGMELFMRETSREIGRLSGRINRIWGAPFHNTIVNSPLYFLHAYKYNYRNPVAAGVTERVEDYPWSTLPILLGQRRGIIPMITDETLFNDINGTLKWLNEAYSAENAEALRKALRKKQFKIAADPITKVAHPLTSWDSILKDYAVNTEMLGGTFGGPDRDRTCDLEHAMLALSQLSYRPKLFDSQCLNLQPGDV